ncbi:MAG: sensor histidine kinase [Lysobacteraceae bacterium]
MNVSLSRPAPDSIASRHAREGKLRHVLLINLVWTIWVFADFLFNNRIDRAWVLATAISFPVFLALYVSAYLQSQRYIVFFALGMAALGYTVMPWNHSGGTSYLIYSCAYLAFFGSVRQSVAMMLLIVSGYVLSAWLQDWPWVITIAMSMVALSVGGGNLAYRLNARKDADLRLSHEEVRRLAATAERERIGRDLHDLLVHTLSMIALKSELARKLFDRDPQAARREIADVERITRDALTEVRRAVSGIRAAALAGEVASARLLLECANVQFDYDGFDAPLPVEQETCLALGLREAVTNIHRHAQARYAHAKLRIDAQAAELRVQDDGRGTGAHEGNGLSGMRERVSALGGTLRIESVDPRGTLLILRLPLPGAVIAPATDADLASDVLPLRRSA